MLTLAAPFWLIGLALLPAIRWLHRGGRQAIAVPVSRLALWRGAAASTPSAGEHQPPDPAWRRRALLTALLFIALAEPQWPEQRTRITLWIDDSLSMLTRESQGSRLVEGLAQASSLLSEVAQAEVEVRTLGDPWRSLGPLGDATAATLGAGIGRQAPSAPPAGLLRRDRLNWLLTDGAHAALLDWPGGMRPDRVIRVGGVTRNVGIERLSARRNLDDAARIDVLLKLTNGGTAAETRVVSFITDAGEPVRSTHRLDPGASVLVNAVMPVAAAVRATLEPGDALAEDDAIALDLGPLRRRQVASDSKCPGPLLAAVGAHPALVLVSPSASGVDAVLDCGTPGAATGVPTLRVLADRTLAQPAGLLQWSSAIPASRAIRLDAENLRIASRLQPGPADEVLLAAGDEPVLISRAGVVNWLETSIDFDSMGRAARPEVPLLVNLMFERLLGSPLLDEIAITDRGPAAATVVPARDMATTAAATVPRDVRVMRDGVGPMLVVAVLVLLWEIVALGRQWLGLRRTAGVEPA